MNPWAILGIEPCDDARAVKRAYAKQLKLTRPDEKPQEFQQLHAAYKQALNIAQKRSATEGSSHTAQPVESPQPDVSPQPGVSPQSIESPQPIESLLRDESPQPIENPLPERNAPAEPAGPVEASALGTEEIPDSTTVAVEILPESSEDQGAEQAQLQRAAAEAERQKRIDEYQRVLRQVELALQNDRLIGMEKTWHFLAESPYILEDEYNWNLGLGVFDRFARYNQQAPEKGRRGKYRPQVTANILNYCDHLFDWSGNRAYISREMDEGLADAIFTALQEPESGADPLQGVRGGRELVKQKDRVPEESLDQYYFGHLLARAFAVLLDLFLIYVTVGLATSVIMMKAMGKSEADANVTALALAILGYLLMAWLVESSPLQATPGKYLLGYRVTNREFRRIGYLHGFWRMVSFLLTLPLFKVGWLINCFLGGNLMHDRLSRSYVINFRKSREEYLRNLNS